MLNSKLLFMLLAIHSALPMKKDNKLGKKLPFPKQANCDTMKCPAVEQPICAKLVYKNAGNKTVYVVMVNKCEMNYVKCYEGLDAIVVPMESCGHNKFIKSGNKRSKREVEEEEQLKKLKEQALKGTQGEDKSRAKIVVVRGTTPDYESDCETSGSEYDPDDMSSSDIEKKYDIDDYGGYEGDFDGDGDEDDGEYQDGDEENEYNEDHDYIVEDSEYGESDEHSYEESDDENSAYSVEKEMLTAGIGVDLTGDIKGFNEDVNIKEYYSDCPTVCPSRDVMVCARCQHGMFRTFLSVCHMRMFGCQHTDESLDLIARLPCTMSAPYLSDASMQQPTGRVREPNDDDRVLRYLRCRELSKISREGDPRCKFMNDKDTKLMGETFKEDDDY